MEPNDQMEDALARLSAMSSMQVSEERQSEDPIEGVRNSLGAILQQDQLDCVMTIIHERLDPELSSYDSLKRAYNDVLEEYSGVEDMNEELRKQIQTMKDDIAYIKDQLHGVQDQNGSLQTQNGDLLAQFQGIQAQNGSLQTQNGDLLAQFQGIQAQNGSLQTQNGDLLAQFQGIQAQNGNLQTRNENMQAQVEGIQAQSNDLQAHFDHLALRVDAYDDLMAIPFALNVANELWKGVAQARCCPRQQVEQFMITCMNLTNATHAGFEDLQLERNRAIHNLLMIVTYIKKFERNPVLLNSGRRRYVLAAEIITKAEPIVFYLIASEVIQFCKQTLAPNRKWTFEVSEKCIDQVHKVLVNSGVTRITVEELSAMFASFTTQRAKEENSNLPRKTMDREDIVSCINTWLADQGNIQPDMCPSQPQVAVILLNAVQLLSAAASIGEVTVRSVDKIKIKLTRGRQQALFKLSELFKR